MEPVISIEGLRVEQGDNFSLAITSLELQPRRIYALTGPNGAGKSTLLRTLALLTPPQQGRIGFAAAAGQGRAHQRRRVTLVEQSPYLLAGTVYANLAFGLKLRGIRGKEQQARIARNLALVGLEGFAGRKTGQLSGGEVQRVALARALVLEPLLLLLDEPTSNIDAKSLQAFELLLSGLPARGVTVVISTHDPDQPKRLGAEVLRLEDGRLLDSCGSPAEQSLCQETEKKLWLKALNAQGL